MSRSLASLVGGELELLPRLTRLTRSWRARRRRRTFLRQCRRVRAADRTARDTLRLLCACSLLQKSEKYWVRWVFYLAWQITKRDHCIILKSDFTQYSPLMWNISAYVIRKRITDWTLAVCQKLSLLLDRKREGTIKSGFLRHHIELEHNILPLSI